MKWLVVVSVFAFALAAPPSDTDTTKTTQKKRTAGTDPKKKADEWVDALAKSQEPQKRENHDADMKKIIEGWNDMLAALKRKYGTYHIPCRIFDAARDHYYQDFLLLPLIKYGYNPETSREAFMEWSDLPTKWTLTGRKRQGCVE